MFVYVIRRSEANLRESSLSFYHVVPETELRSQGLAASTFPC